LIGTSFSGKHFKERWMLICLSVNVGNARLYGLEADLGMHGNMFQLAVSILFVTYVLGEGKITKRQQLTLNGQIVARPVLL
jgi:hypothetical protein